VLGPDGTSITAVPVCCYIDNAIVKAITLAFRWRELLETCDHRGIAAAEKINESYEPGTLI
jgi:hypothetical protein